MDHKQEIIQKIIAQLENDLQVLSAAATQAYKTATDEENVPENKYDTLGLEAGYLAQGQAKRVQEILSSIGHYKTLSLKTFDQYSPIQLTALVSLVDNKDQTKNIFLGPSAGGLKIDHKNRQITISTLKTPMGEALLGKKCGDDFEINLNGQIMEYTITDVE